MAPSERDSIDIHGAINQATDISRQGLWHQGPCSDHGRGRWLNLQSKLSGIKYCHRLYDLDDKMMTCNDLGDKTMTCSDLDDKLMTCNDHDNKTMTGDDLGDG